LAICFLLIPLAALVWQAPWGDLAAQLSDPVVRKALTLSLITSGSATLLVVLFGVPLAWVLAESDTWPFRLLRALVVLPLVLPPVVGGVALLLAFGRRGLFGGPLYDWFGISIPFTPAAVVMAETFVALPFLVLTVEGTLRARERRYEEIASALGASRWRVARQITLPLIGPGIVAGAVLAWARALGEFGATITFAGNFSGRTQTVPLAVYQALETNRDVAIALSLVLVVVSVVVLFMLRGRWRF
jgi:molybdate transport system permease protein